MPTAKVESRQGGTPFGVGSSTMSHLDKSSKPFCLAAAFRLREARLKSRGCIGGTAFARGTYTKTGIRGVYLVKSLTTQTRTNYALLNLNHFLVVAGSRCEFADKAVRAPLVTALPFV